MYENFAVRILYCMLCTSDYLKTLLDRFESKWEAGNKSYPIGRAAILSEQKGLSTSYFKDPFRINKKRLIAFPPLTFLWSVFIQKRFIKAIDDFLNPCLMKRPGLLKNYKEFKIGSLACKQYLNHIVIFIRDV